MLLTSTGQLIFVRWCSRIQAESQGGGPVIIFSVRQIYFGSLALALLVVSSRAIAGTPSFMGLGQPAGETLAHFTVNGVSADGSTVVGTYNIAGALSPFKWTSATGVVALHDPTVGPNNPEAYAASADGSVIVGCSRASEAVVWTSSGDMFSIGDLPGGTVAACASGVSNDGSTIVGSSIGENGPEAFIWTGATGIMGLGDLSGGYTTSAGYGVSADGTTIVGLGWSGFDYPEAFRWTESSGMVGLGYVPGFPLATFARAVSADGNTVVGAMGTGREDAFIWTESSGMTSLTAEIGGSFESDALSVSGDGSIVVGRSSAGAFIWDDLSGLRSLQDVLTSDYGLDLSGWSLTRATGITPDGMTIVGQGRAPSGRAEGWIAHIPEPTSAGLFSIVASILLYRRGYKEESPLSFRPGDV